MAALADLLQDQTNVRNLAGMTDRLQCHHVRYVMSQMIGTSCHVKPSCDQEARGLTDLPEYPLSLQTVRLLEEVDGGDHDGRDGALLVVDDPLQRHTELLAGHPAGHGQVGGGDCLGQPEHGQSAHQ